MKLTCFARPSKFWTRLVMMIIGVTVQGFGLSLLIRLALGTDPCSCLTQGVINYVPISFGTAQLLCHLVTFVFVLRFDMSYIGFGTIGNMVFLGYIADFFGWIWDGVLPQGFFSSQAVRWGLLVPVLIVFILGAATYMTAGLGSSPYDAMPFIISHKCKKIPFKAIRMIWDISFMAAGFALGGDVGIVTLGVAFFLGPVISFMQKKLAVLLK
jgi:Predicted membrane protein